MSDPIIVCPNCRTEIKLTESLAAPLIESTRKQYEQQIARKDLEISNREKGLSQKEQEIAERQRTIDSQIKEQVASIVADERKKAIEEASRIAKFETAAELEAKSRELSEMQEILRVRDQKLVEAQKIQVELLKKQREFDDEKREFDLTIEKRVQLELGEARAAAKREAEDSLKMRVMEKDQTIASMQQKIEELKQKAEQGSQQLQGEVQEIDIENILRAKFPFDSVEPVPKGEFGGDLIQRVTSQTGQACGEILWESKRTRNWSDAWLAKLRDDQRAAKAEISILVTQTLPKGVETFDLIEGVWVVSPRVILPVATMLRETLLQVSLTRQITDGQLTKTELVYQYLTGPRFRHRVEAIVEAFSSMRDDLDRERKAIMKQWSKRESQIERVMGATVGMYGDLQGIAGKSLQEISGLSIENLDESDKS